MATYASLADVSARLRRKLEAVMFSGEEFLGAIDTWHRFRFVTTEVLILTDQRIIQYQKGLVRESTTDFDRNRITNVSFDKGLVRRNLTVSGSGFSETWRVPYTGGQEFAAAIRAPEPQPVYDQSVPQAESSTAGTTGELEHGRGEGEIESARITDPDAEMFGFDRWHYVTAAGLVLLWLAYAVGLRVVIIPLLIGTGIAMYVDILLMREASTWQPRAWLYELGMVIVGIGAAAYLFNRYRVTTSDEQSEQTATESQ